MTYTFARRNAGEYNNIRFMFAVLGLLVSLVLVIASSNFYYNALRGPFDTQAADILRLDSLDNLTNYYVRINGMAAYDTGYQYVKKSSGIETSHDSFVALRLDDQLLIVKIGGDASEDTTYTGTLIPLSGEVQREVVDKLIGEEPSLKGHFLPYLLDTSEFRMSGIMSLLLMTVLIIGFTWMLTRALVNIIGSTRRPRLSIHTRIGDEAEVLSQVEMELKQRHQTFSSGFHLTPHWLVHYSAAYMSATRPQDVAWVYKDAIQIASMNQMRYTYVAMIYDRYGTKMVVSSSENQVDNMVKAVMKVSPWAVNGYKPEWEAVWLEDREKFVAAVDRRRVFQHTS